MNVKKVTVSKQQISVWWVRLVKLASKLWDLHNMSTNFSLDFLNMSRHSTDAKKYLIVKNYQDCWDIPRPVETWETLNREYPSGFQLKSAETIVETKFFLFLLYVSVLWHDNVEYSRLTSKTS
jgi:hypothetical protein